MTTQDPQTTTVTREASAVAGAAAGLLVGLGLLVLGVVEDVGMVSLLPIESSIWSAVLHLLAAPVLGGLIAVVFPGGSAGPASVVSTGVLVGLLWWIVGPLSLGPVLGGSAPEWSLADAVEIVPNLVASLLFGGITALLADAAAKRGLITGVRPSAAGQAVDLRDRTASDAPTNVVIIGGGFGGVAVAQRLEQLAERNRNLNVTIVSPSNFLLFTPMLAEVAGSSLEPQHISAPIRAVVPRTRFIRARATNIDVDAQVVHLDKAGPEVLLYDHLVLALGSVPNFRDLPGMEEHSFALKSLDDATTLRNHVITMMERADSERDPIKRRRMLTFVVAGGGFAGTEMIAEIFDLAFSALRYYPAVPIGELRFVLVHSRDRILPEIGPELADYALNKLRDRGIEFLLDTRVAGATADAMQLADGTEIPTNTVVWTAGNQPNPLLRAVPGEHNRAGALLAGETLQLVGHDNIWAVGDCAQIPDPDNPDTFYPPTAQHALREGKAVADNIVAVESGAAAKPFRFKTIGVLVALGHRTAAAEIRGLRFSGLLAWMMWRAIYLGKLPGVEKKVRVLFDWTIDLLFPRDIVLTEEVTADAADEWAGDQPTSHGGVR